jgi:hypothetical protein
MRAEKEENIRVADEESAFAAATRGKGSSSDGMSDAAWMDEPVHPQP